MHSDRNGGHLVAEWMSTTGVGHFFHVPGETFLTVLDGLRRFPDIRVVTHRHESGAAFAAEAVGKLTGRAAVCMATRGPGSSNLAIGLQTAHYDATPVIALVTQVPRAKQDSGAFQEYDPRAMFGSTTKQVLRVGTIEALSDTLTQAHAIAHSGRPGPVVVALPTDVLTEARRGPGPARYSVAGPAAGAVDELAEALSSAARPLLLVSTRPVRDPAVADLAEFAEACGLPVVVGWRRFSSYPNDHPSFVGGMGAAAPTSTLAAVREADLIVSFGFGAESMTTDAAGRPGASCRLIQIAPELDIRALRLSGTAREIDFLTADPAGYMRALGEWARNDPEAAGRMRATHAGRTAQLRADRQRHLSAESPAGPSVRMDALFRAVNAQLPDDAIVSSDAGNFARWLQRYVEFGGDRVFLGPVNGAMGYGLPGAIGAALACPDRPVWCMAGDGGFMMTGSEMETAARFGLSVKALVVNNGAYGSIRRDQERKFPGVDPIGTTLGQIDFPALARGMGWTGFLVEREQEVPAALTDLAKADGPALLEVRIDSRQLEV